MATLGALYLLRQSIHARSGDLHAQLTSARVRVQPAVAEVMPIGPDFARSLSNPLEAAPVLDELRRACSASGALLTGIQANENVPSIDQLGRLDLTVTLRGPYPAAKLVLERMLEHFSGSTLQRLRMRQSQVMGEVDAVFTLSFWSEPERRTEQADKAASVVAVRRQ